MKNSTKYGLVSSLLIFALSMSAHADEHMVNTYVNSSDGSPVTDTRGECVRTTRKDSTDKREACGYEHPKPVVKSVEVVATPTAVSATARKADKVVVAAKILFDFDSDKLSDDGKAIIIERINALGHEENQAEITVVGHTCSMGPADYNMQLSERRAEAVADFIEQMKKSPDANVEHSGEGETNPIASNDTREGRQLNRRVTITAVGKLAE